MKRTMTLLTIAAFVLATTTAVQAATTTQTIPVTSIVTDNPCNGEAIALEGVVHAVFSSTINDNTVHTHTNLNYQLRGESLVTGTKYKLSQIVNQNITLAKGTTRTEVQRLEIVAQGQAPNYATRATLHITVNANGDVTVSFVKFEIECH